jgi:TrmH family RNA methyltransferase
LYDLRRSLSPAGPGHRKVREFFEIKTGRGHGADRLTLEGLWLIRAARHGDCEIDTLFVCVELLRGPASLELVGELVDDGVAAYSVSPRVLHRMAGRDGPDGLAAIGRHALPSLDDVTPPGKARCLVVDGCELPGNLGSLVRCADAVGACAVLATGSKVRLRHPLVLKASMGAVFSVPLVATTQPDARRWLRANAFHLLAAVPSSAHSYLDAVYPSRVAVVVGSERDGLNRFWVAAADERVSIPMLGSADSLNVGHAGAVLLYEALARHEGRGPGRFVV